jgi:hypothetical protein
MARRLRQSGAGGPKGKFPESLVSPGRVVSTGSVKAHVYTSSDSVTHVIVVRVRCCLPTGSGASKGFMVDLAASAESCLDDSRNIVAVAIGRHRAKLNAEPDATFPETVQRFREVVSVNAEKIVYVRAEAEVSWGEFMELVDDVWPEVNVVSILTPQVEKMSRRTYCLGPSCRDCTKFGELPHASPVLPIRSNPHLSIA